MKFLFKSASVETINLDEKIISNYIESIRPPVEMRHKIDLGYSYKIDEVTLFEIKPLWNDDSKFLKYPFVKAKYIKSENNWKIYRMLEDGKWELYKPNPTVHSIESFIDIVEENEHGLFRG